ncbi:LIM domain only protein 7-like [Fundulus diaphanus]
MLWDDNLSQTRISAPCYGSSPVTQSALPSAPPSWEYGSESGSDSDPDRPDPDLVLDDLASRRFHSPSPAPPTNFAVPASPSTGGRSARGKGAPWPKVTVSPAQPYVTCDSGTCGWLSPSSSKSRKTQSLDRSYVRVDHRRGVCSESLFRYDDSEDEDDDEVGYADPVQDDLYARKIGATPQRASGLSYNKFLPKFWTPEEDVHIQKIKLGSQRRPWYKKMQGFSPHAPANPTPQLPKIEPPLLEIPPLVFPPVDPASGPRLVKCEKWPLLGREDPREPPDPVDYASIDPDLENDDMFTRRTLSFQANAGLAVFKTRLPARRRLHSSEPLLNIVTQQHLQIDADEDDFPDIEQDDVVYRKGKTLQAQQQRALSGAPDNYAPMRIPEPWALPAELKSRLLCPPCPLTREATTTEQDQAKEEARPEEDDMLVRKLRDYSDQSQQRGPSAGHGTPSVPSSRSEGDLQRWQAIREACQLRYKRRLLLERLKALKV